MQHHPDDEHDLGLGHDLRLLNRRRALTLLGAGVATVAVACGANAVDTSAPTGTAADTSTTSTRRAGGSTSSSSTSSPSSSAASSSTAAPSTTGSSTTTAASSTACAETPTETGGPFPGDGTNGPNALTQSGIVRSDIRSSFGSSSTVADGVPLTVNLSVRELAQGCAALAGAAVYIWHCDIDGQYSMYGQGVTNENYLRGVQEAGSDGRLSFTSIFPAAYSGRWPHIHFEVFPNLAAATTARGKLLTSQLALPADTCDAVYATNGYSQSVRNMRSISMQRDMVFSDGASLQIPTVSGNVGNGLTIDLPITV